MVFSGSAPTMDSIASMATTSVFLEKSMATQAAFPAIAFAVFLKIPKAIYGLAHVTGLTDLIVIGNRSCPGNMILRRQIQSAVMIFGLYAKIGMDPSGLERIKMD